jgi:hypothetical protein
MAMKPERWAAAAGLAAALGSAVAWAGQANYQPYAVGDRAAGMGGAATATAEGMDAGYYNPAGLAWELSDSISANGTLYGVQRYDTKDAAFPGEDFSISTFTTIPVGLSAIRKVRDGLAASFSVYVPAQTSAREIQAYPEVGHYYNYSQDEQMLVLGPSVGYALDERTSVGLSLFGVYQTASEFENLYWGDLAYTYTANYKYSVLGAYAMAGIQRRIGREGWIGASLSSPSATITGRGSAQFSAVQAAEGLAGAESVYYEDLDADNGLPALLRVGLGWRRPGVAGFEASLAHHFGRTYKWMDGEQDGERVEVEQRREPVTDVQVGGEVVWRGRYPLRAGLFTSFSSAPGVDPEADADLAQVDLYGATVSAGVVGRSVSFNVGLSYVWGKGDELGVAIDGNGDFVASVNATREKSLYAFASTAYRF